MSSLKLGMITIYQLVTHTSGLELLPRHFRKTYEYSYEEFMDLVYKSTLGFYPGCGWRYSHTGYILLIFIIEMVTEQTYFDFMKSNIFQPLQMKSVISNHMFEYKSFPKITHGYRQKTIRRSRSQPIGNMMLTSYIENEEP
jgi:CubicO group peptidase (beta-lactamase class C family)